MAQPPHIDANKLDFSRFHPLDHWPGTPRCRSLYGGPRNHLGMAWEFRWGPTLASWTLCRIGEHRMVDGWERRGDEDWTPYRVCRNCAHR